MKETWATSGLDLQINLSGTRVRESLERQLRSAVQGGLLVPGTLLPPSRTLAVDLGIARNTVVDAYGQLVSEGWLTAQRGSGTRVATQVSFSAIGPSESPAPALSIGYDLRPGFPDVALFPRSEWMSVARTALANAPSEALGYGDPQGRPELRGALASYLSRARGVRVAPGNVVICSGFSQALWILGRILRTRGESTIGVESYGHQRHRELLVDVGLQLRGLRVDDLGAVPSDLDGLGAALLTAAHQFPLGVALETHRRKLFVDWAAASGALVIEDDYDGEFRYDRRAVGAMQSLAPRQVVYAGTASKTLAPGLRLSWLVASPDLVEAVVEEISNIGSQPAVLEQLTLALFIDSGRYDRHVRRSRLAYRRRRDQLVATLERRVPSATLRGLPAGLHTLVELPRGVGEEEAVAKASTMGLAVDHLSSYATGTEDRAPALVIGYATPPTYAYATALERLCGVLAE